MCCRFRITAMHIPKLRDAVGLRIGAENWPRAIAVARRTAAFRGQHCFRFAHVWRDEMRVRMASTVEVAT
jgi:hypothetical protein